jgi:hypothetical protein
MFLKYRKPKNWKNAHAKGRKTSVPRVLVGERQVEREIEAAMPAPSLPSKKKDKKREYLAANCVVLAAAILGVRSKRWAEDMLPMARALDGRHHGY